MAEQGISFSFNSLVGFLVTFLIISAICLTGDQNIWRIQQETVLHTADTIVKNSNNSLEESCDLFSGKWVFDNKSYPLYKEKECSFMFDDYACERFGRKDFLYQNWRWQPHQCDLPRFNGTKLLEELKNKRIVYVGDSLNRDQWVSMVCLVESSIPSPLKSLQFNGNLINFRAIEYNASIDFYWAPLLVESNSDDPINHRLPDRIVRVESITKHAMHWTDSDIIIFNSYLWWLRPKMMVLWGTFESGIYKEIDMLRSYELALKTWSDWLEIHVNLTRTRLFFVGMSPTHFNGEEWGMGTNQNCYNETEPIMKQGYRGKTTNMAMMEKLEGAIEKLERRGVKVKLMNITQLSEYRKEGHPSIYRRQWVKLSEEQLQNPPSYSDCAHWCLPGIPDTWNQLLYTFLFHFH